MPEYENVVATVRIPKEWVEIATEDTSPFIMGNAKKLDLEDASYVELHIEGLFDMEETQPAGDDTTDVAVLRGELVPRLVRLDVIG
jgi:hypothetical protein